MTVETGTFGLGRRRSVAAPDQPVWVAIVRHQTDRRASQAENAGWIRVARAQRVGW